MGGAPAGALVTQASAGIISAATAGGTRPIQRNALMTVLIPIGFWVGGAIIAVIFGILAAVTGVFALARVGGLINWVCYLGGLYFFAVPYYKMACEVKSVTNNQGFTPWMAFIPIYGPIILLPQEVTNAKRIVGAPEPTRSLVVYFFVPNYGLAADLNDIAARIR